MRVLPIKDGSLCFAEATLQEEHRNGSKGLKSALLWCCALLHPAQLQHAFELIAKHCRLSTVNVLQLSATAAVAAMAAMAAMAVTAAMPELSSQNK
jgi:hypothetical protein